MSQRIAKVQKLALEVLGEAIQGLKDPRIGFATLTAVRVSADLRHAKVFVSILGSEEERTNTMAGLVSATPFLLPELTFVLDTGPEEAERVESIIKQIHEEEGSED